MGKFFGPDVKTLCVPIVFATCLFGYMVTRTLVMDPEQSKAGFEFYDRPESEKIAERYRMQHRSMFLERIQRGARSLFNNDPADIAIPRDKHTQ